MIKTRRRLHMNPFPDVSITPDDRKDIAFSHASEARNKGMEVKLDAISDEDGNPYLLAWVPYTEVSKIEMLLKFQKDALGYEIEVLRAQRGIFGFAVAFLLFVLTIRSC